MTLLFSTDPGSGTNPTLSRHAAPKMTGTRPRDRTAESAASKAATPVTTDDGADADAPEPVFECQFDMIAAADAGLLPRALEIVARLDIAPRRCVAETDERGLMTISLTFRGLSTDQARTASERMRNIFGVESVSLSLTPRKQAFMPALQVGG